MFFGAEIELSTFRRKQNVARTSTGRYYGRCLLIQMYFCKDHDYGEKVDLSKGYRNPRRKMWIITHFSKIINQPQF